jgi:Putative threonine efflux protein
MSDKTEQGLDALKQQMSLLSRTILNRIRQHIHYEPVIGIMGKTGSGKSSLCNALFQQPISDVQGCTREPLRFSFDVGGCRMTLADLPGAGESLDYATLVMSSALAGGHKGLFRTLAGTALGIYTHAVLIGLGITAVLISSPEIFTVLKISGIAYLLWLGMMLIISGMKARHREFTDTRSSVTLREAWVANILNPKTIIFYLTVVSQFAGQQGGVSNYLALASVHVIVMSVWLLAISRTLIFSVKKPTRYCLKNTSILREAY